MSNNNNNNGGSIFDTILQRMRLSRQEHGAMVVKIMSWIQTQRPNYMFTTVLALSVLAARMSKAFSCRAAPGITAATAAAAAAAAAAAKSRAASGGGSPQKSSPPLSQQQRQLSSQQQAQSGVGQQQGPPMAAGRRKKKAFRSVKKLDLSPRVVDSLEGFVADLAASIPLIIQHAEYEQEQESSWPGGFVTSKPPTAADIIDILLELLEGNYMTPSQALQQQMKNNKNNSNFNSNMSSNHTNAPNAAMELFRRVLARSATNNNTNNNGNSPSNANNKQRDPHEEILDQLKFKTFCVKTLESAQTRSIDIVESFLDFRFLWSTCRKHQHLIVEASAAQDTSTNNNSHVNMKLLGSADQQEALAWRLATYLVWRRQEDHPDLCSRRERLSAGATSIIIVSVIAFLHRHNRQKPQEAQQAAQPASTNSSGNPQEQEATAASNTISNQGETIHQNKDPTSTTNDRTADATMSEAGQGSLTTGQGTDQVPDAATSAQNKDNANKSNDGSESSKRSIEPGANGSNNNDENDNDAKLRRVSSTGDVHAGVPAVDKAEAGAADETDKRVQQTQGPCQGCTKQERPIQVVIHATRQALSFLRWATKTAPSSGNNEEGAVVVEDETNASAGHTGEHDIGTEVSRAELDQKLLNVARHLATFSSYPTKDSDSWFEVMKAAINLRDNDDSVTAETIARNFLRLLDAALASMKIEDAERMGTRVEAVAYVDELSLIAFESKYYTDYICQTVSNRQKIRNELIACVPDPSLASQASDYKPSGPNKTSHPGYKPIRHAAAVDPRLLLMEDEKNTLGNNSRTVSPPVLTEPMELNEWTVAVLASLSQIQPKPSLLSILYKASEATQGGVTHKWQTVIIPVLNRFVNRMHQSLGMDNAGPPPMTVDQNGLVHSTERTQDTQLWAAIVQMYYHSLESILQFEKRGHAKLVRTEAFHEALLACCYLCIAQAVTITGKMRLHQPENHQIYTIMPMTGSTPYTYLKVAESFLRALTTTVPEDAKSKRLNEAYGNLPRILQKEIKASEVYVVESLVWAREHTPAGSDTGIVNSIAELRLAELWPPKCLKPSLPEELEDLEDEPSKIDEEKQQVHRDAAFVSYIMRKLLQIAYFRIQTVCQELQIPAECPVASQVWIAFRFLLRNHVELLYGRHVDQWILCTLYGISKVMKYEPDLTFAQIVQAYVSLRGEDLGERTCQAIVRHITILDGTGDGDDNGGSYGATKTGNIIRLYNLVFVPLMKSYLLKSNALRKSTASLKTVLAENRNTPPKARSDKPRDEAVSKRVTAGNVSVQLTLQRDQGTGASTASMMSGQPDDVDAADTVPGTPSAEKPAAFSTFLQFGRTKVRTS